MRAGLDACRDAAHTIVFVLGHPAFYPRFGFEAAAPRGLHYEGGAGYAPAFFVAELAAGVARGSQRRRALPAGVRGALSAHGSALGAP